MGLVNKLKNILFEEEEVEIPVIDKKEKAVSQANFEREAKKEHIEYKELPKKEFEKQSQYDNFYSDLDPVIKEEKKMEDRNSKYAELSDRELFKNEKTFNFPAFDEEEFQNVVPRTRGMNSYEENMVSSRIKKEKQQEYKKSVRIEEKEVPKNKFRPSPIISPVYGILDKNYTPDEIKTREVPSNHLDVDSVRKKAFGSLEERKKKMSEERKKEEIENKILEEKLEKARTIDELLKDSSDEVIKVNSKVKVDENYVNEIETLDNTIEKKKSDFDEETLENDLFDLIDSMYENREDGE